MTYYGVYTTTTATNNNNNNNNNNSMVSVCLVNSSFDFVISSMQSANERKYSCISSCVGGTDHVCLLLLQTYIHHHSKCGHLSLLHTVWKPIHFHGV